jgi:hypothetical protein
MDPSEGGYAPTGWTITKAGAAELVTNGHFASNDLTGWTAAAGWAATTGSAVHTAGIADTTPLQQNISLANTKVYQVIVKTSGRTAGTLTLSCENATISPVSGVISSANVYFFTLTATATDATSMLALTPNAAFDGQVDYITVRINEISNATRARNHADCGPFPSCDALDIAIDATPNKVTASAVLTLQEVHDYCFSFRHLWYHDNVAVVDPNVAAHTPTITIKTHDASLSLQADLTWAAGAYAFPITLSATKEQFRKHFTSPTGDTSFLVVFDSDDMQGATVYKEHIVLDDFHCEDLTDAGLV